MPKLDPVSLAQGMQCSRWPGLGHVSTTSRVRGGDHTHPKNMVRELGESVVLQRETECCFQTKRTAGLQKQPVGPVKTGTLAALLAAMSLEHTECMSTLLTLSLSGSGTP